jgi:hypothetical protein
VENLQISEGREWMAPPLVTCRWSDGRLLEDDVEEERAGG